MKNLSANILILAGFLCLGGAYGLYSHNQEIDRLGQEHCETITSEFHALLTTSVVVEEHEPSPEVETVVPVRNEGIMIQGDLYIGLLEIPRMNITLPIHMDLSMSKLATAPCVYAGALADGDLVIAGHNYKSHFWSLRTLEEGDTMTMTDPNGREYRYQVVQQEVLHETEVAVLMDRDQWDLTLYTCDYPDNNYRVVIRCKRI